LNLREGDITFEFKGKKGVEWKVSFSDSLVNCLIGDIYKIPGDGETPLFRYVENGKLKCISKDMINRFRKPYQISAKDFRTYHATRICAENLIALGKGKTKKEDIKNIRIAVSETASLLGHTPAMCRKSYIHPFILSNYLKGELGNLSRYFIG
jgi:DNA topoisomerase I